MRYWAARGVSHRDMQPTIGRNPSFYTAYYANRNRGYSSQAAARAIVSHYAVRNPHWNVKAIIGGMPPAHPFFPRKVRLARRGHAKPRWPFSPHRLSGWRARRLGQL